MKKIISSVLCSVGVILALVAHSNNTLKTSPEGLAHIANLEGCRNQTYQCSAGTWTNGMGHTAKVKQGDIVNNQEIADNFIQDVASSERVVTKSLRVDVTAAQYDVMVSFVFNLGAGNFKRSALLKKMNKKQFKSACYEFTRWVYVNGKNCHEAKNQCTGIVKRRAIEKQVCLNGW
ncbi:lysozyme [Psychromonas sp. PRT-SC03]|nr:lysozyme [Psychromonas sp. PRT-SC03]